MGVFCSSRCMDYSARNVRYPQHIIGRYMTQLRFEQIKRYFHISPPENITTEEWYLKMKLLASSISNKLCEYLLPATDIAVDEMMVHFTGRLVHTQCIPGKPIPCWYKIFALCQNGYTYNFLFTSRIYSIAGLDTALYNCPFSLKKTSKIVYQLAFSSPCGSHRFIIYKNIYLSNIRLLNTLTTVGIGAFGTTRTKVLEGQMLPS